MGWGLERQGGSRYVGGGGRGDELDDAEEISAVTGFQSALDVSTGLKFRRLVPIVVPGSGKPSEPKGN